MENDMKLIAQGAKSKDVVLRDCIAEMTRIFKRVYENVGSMRQYLVAQMSANGGTSYIPAPGEPSTTGQH
jgi:hypothetical protein